MNHLLIAPVVLPALVAPFILATARHDPVLQRVFGLAATAAQLAVCVALFALAADGTPRAYLLGDWPAPFGIVLVLDRLSALMLLLTAVLATATLAHAVASGWDRRGRHFHALYQFQLMGLQGAFLTGDIFNLFVFFEVLLIASYGLMLHGAGAARITHGLKYVAVNLLASTLFLFAVGLLYAVTGTLNLADLAVRVSLIPTADGALLRVSAALLLVVFAIKAALVPLHFWLPGTYGAAAPPVAALFAVMTKLGAYAILRVFTLVFGESGGAAAWIAGPYVLPAAVLTLVLGTAGVLAARTLTAVAVWALLGSVGTLLLGVGLFTPAGTAAGLYYLVHSTLAGASLFLLADLVARRRGAAADVLNPGSRFAHAALLGALFLAAAIAAVGLPPLSGFVGKLLILRTTFEASAWPWLWAAILVTSLLALVGFARAGSLLFWRCASDGRPSERAGGSGDLAALWATGTLVAAPLLLALFAGPTMTVLDATADQLFAPRAYIEAVLGRVAVTGQPR